ncbi:MAG: BhlA/UviB family holin-like peptide [Alkaliphilus sp.]
MELEVLQVAATHGIWTLLSVSLIFYILKNQEKRDVKQEQREVKYQEIISALTERLNIIDDIKDDVLEVKMNLFSKDS